MSFQNLINDALDAAKRFLKWILPSSKHLLDVALIIVNGFKTFDDKQPGILNWIVSLIPGTVDNHILDKVRALVPALIVKLRWSLNEAGKSEDEILADAQAYIKSLEPAEQAGQLQLLWQLISNHLTDDGVAMSDIQKIGQVFYETASKQS